MERELETILRNVRSGNPKKRYEALVKLEELKEKERISIDLPVLHKMIATAAKPFPEKVDTWDEGSLYLLSFVSDFKEFELALSFIRHFQYFDEAGKYLAIDYLCSFDVKEFEQFILQFYVERLEKGEPLIVPDNLYNHSTLITQLFTEQFSLLRKPEYKNDFFNFLNFCIRNQTNQSMNEEEIIPIVLQEYALQKETYLPYDKAYSTRNVYRFWKEEYYKLRERMIANIRIMGYFFTEPIEALLQEALLFEDPFIKMEAVIELVKHNKEVAEEVILACATNVETSVSFYFALEAVNRLEIFPAIEKRQHVFAKTQLFHFLIDDDTYKLCPTDMQVECIEDFITYEEVPTRFYGVSFTDEDEKRLFAWVGGFPLEKGDDLPYMFDETYREETLFEEKTIEEHVQSFRDRVQQIVKVLAETIVYESSPNLPSFYKWFGKKRYEEKLHLLQLRGSSIVCKKGTEQTSIMYYQIKKIVIIQQQPRRIEVYDKQDHLVLTFPAKTVDVDLLIAFAEEFTMHLKDPIQIEVK